MPAGTHSAPAAFGDLLRRRAADDSPAVYFGDEIWTYRALVAEGRRRAALFADLADPVRPPHVGVLLDNGPEYLFWLTAAAIAGTVLVAINPTYRGAHLSELVAHTDCQVLVTSTAHTALFRASALPVTGDRLVLADDAAYRERLEAASPLNRSSTPIDPQDLLLLVFTSGSTGIPKAVRCTQGRLRHTAEHVARTVDLTRDDVAYSAVPFFHSAFLSAAWAPAVYVGARIATRARFSASGTVPDIRRYGATYFTYTGKILNYVLATPERADDADTPLRLALGNEASAHDIDVFARRFGCRVHDSYGATEGVIRIRRDPSTPAGALGRPDDAVKVLDPETGDECPPVLYDDGGRPCNLDAAIGEIVHTRPASSFEGYYENEAATNERFRDGRYWSGDLAYRDEHGWLYFAGRSNEWLRVDGENVAAALVEAIVGRHPGVRTAAVYAVPDDPIGDRVMVALELRPGARFDATELDAFLRAQTDLGPKWVPSFVRIDDELPKLANFKLDRTRLRREAWTVNDVCWRPDRHGDLRPLTRDDRLRLAHLLD